MPVPPHKSIWSNAPRTHEMNFLLMIGMAIGIICFAVMIYATIRGLT